MQLLGVCNTAVKNVQCSCNTAVCERYTYIYTPTELYGTAAVFVQLCQVLKMVPTVLHLGLLSVFCLGGPVCGVWRMTYAPGIFIGVVRAPCGTYVA